MTVLRLSVRVRLELAADRLADPATPDLVTELVAGATGRAVDRARATLTGRHPAGLEPVVSVCYRGDELPEAFREQLEAGLRATAGVAAVRLRAGTAARRDTADTRRADEPFDEFRVVPDDRRADGETYLVPSYEEAGRLAPVELHGSRPARAPRPVRRLRLRHFASDTDLWSAAVRAFAGTPPATFVVIAADSAGRPTAGLMRLRPDGTLLEVQWLGRVTEWRPADAGGHARGIYRVAYQADTLRYFRAAATPAEREDVRAELIFDDLRREVAGRPDIDPRILRDLARARARQIPSPPGPSRYYELLTHGQRIQVFEIFSDEVPVGDVPVVVFTQLVTLDPETGQSRGYGDCPPLETPGIADWLAGLGLLGPAAAVRSDEPFLQEPPIESWTPAVAAQLSTLVNEIAGRLDMPRGRFVGGFLLAAMAQIDTICRDLGRVVSPGTASAGSRTLTLKALAAAFGPIGRLAELYPRVIVAADQDEGLPCPLQNRSATWLEHFYETFGPAQDDAVASMFIAACQDVLLDVLESSAREVGRRREHFDAYMTVTRLLLMITLSETADLSDLRERLLARERQDLMTAVANDGLPVDGWTSVSASVADLLADAKANAGTAKPGTVALRPDGYRVLDEKGRWWSRAELDAAIATGRREAFGVDPLLEKISDLPEIVHMLQQAQRHDNAATAAAGRLITQSVDATFDEVLREVAAENVKRTKRVREDRSIAFGMASFTEAPVTTDRDVGAKLYGIHQLADERLRPMFPDERTYVLGLRRLAREEIGKAEILEFFNLVGIAVIAFFCPPAAFLIGAVQAVEGLREAFEHVGIQRAMLDGDEIISQAQAEAELWAQAVGAMLTFLPEVPGLVRGAVSGGRAVVRGEAREAAIAAARQAMRRAAAHLAAVTGEHFAKAFVVEMTKNIVLNLALSAAIQRFAAAVAREVEVTGEASVADLPDMIGQAIQSAVSPRSGP